MHFTYVMEGEWDLLIVGEATEFTLFAKWKVSSESSNLHNSRNTKFMANSYPP